ncbi:MAG TPA: M50 family metallopeptidase [Acidimicrobiales bacterium]|nr:M50 family metallopeptidase [Acidimicrobiales bacterium]
MAVPAPPGPGAPRAPSGTGSLVPPRWSVPLAGTRLRVTVGLAGLVTTALAVGVVGTGAGAWLPLAAVTVLVVSTLVHELGHAWAAHDLGYRVEWVLLGGLTGTTAYSGPGDRPLDRAAVALAGPAASALLVLGLLAVGSTLADGAPSDVTDAATVANAAAAVANLVPFGHSDGRLLFDGLRHHGRRR